MPTDTTGPHTEEAFEFSLGRNDLLFRLQRRIGLVPAKGTGVVRRSVFWVLVTWLPLAVWAVLNDRAIAGAAGEPLLMHFTVHARLLLGIPALHFAEAMSQAVLRGCLPYFVTSGLVPTTAVPAFKEAIVQTARRRDRTLPWVLILALAVGSSLSAEAIEVHELSWALRPDGSLAFAGLWMAVGRTVFLVLVAGWLWRVFLLFGLFRRIGRVGLSLVPTHADGAAGLGFLERVPAMFGPVIFAMSAVASAHWGHQVLLHGAHVTEFKGPMIALLVLVALVFLSPNLAFAPLLLATKERARFEFGTLVGRYGRAAHARWVLGKQVEDAALGAAELGPVTDVNALYEPIRRMRPVPLGMASVASVLLPAIIPMLPVLAIEIPIRELLKGLAKAIM
jgi:hypothetical protein